MFNLQLFILIEQMVKYFQTLMFFFLCFCVCQSLTFCIEVFSHWNVMSTFKENDSSCVLRCLSVDYINTWSILSALIHSDIVVCKNNMMCVKRGGKKVKILRIFPERLWLVSQQKHIRFEMWQIFVLPFQFQHSLFYVINVF